MLNLLKLWILFKAIKFYNELSVGYLPKTWIFWGYAGKVLDFRMGKLKPWIC